MCKVNDFIALLSAGMFIDLTGMMAMLIIRYGMIITGMELVWATTVFGIVEFLVSIAIVWCNDEELVALIEGEEES